MSDREILEKVYEMVSNGYVADIQDDVKSFIEQEWQRRDELLEQEVKDAYANSVDVSDIERHRGLVIGEDGTVKELK
jgi:hypothetical protein